MRILFVACLLSMLAGCQEEGIRVVEVPKEPSQAVRAIIVMVPHGDATWFFKMSGPADAVAADESGFGKLIDSVRFSDGEPPVSWTLPENWADSGKKTRERFATLRSASGVEVPITVFGKETAGVAKNVERWRRQIGLGPVPDSELPKLTNTIKVGGVDATWADLLNPGPQPVPLKRGEPAAEPTSSTASSRKLTFQPSAGWEQISASSSGVKFRAGHGESTVTIGVTGLDGNAGGFIANVNEWRRQLGLPTQEEAAIRAAAKELTVDGKPTPYVDLLGEGDNRRRTLAVMAERGGKSWFIVMRGPADEVARQQAAFESFVRSLRFPEGSE
ncbi:MAG: hypothetical protein ACJ8C4_08035 [Gemmataceae bacterium]